MIALMHVDMERRLDTVADVAPIGIADLYLHIAHYRARNPGDHALQHVLRIELAGSLVLAHRREGNDTQRPAVADELAFTHSRIRIGQCRPRALGYCLVPSPSLLWLICCRSRWFATSSSGLRAASRPRW